MKENRGLQRPAELKKMKLPSNWRELRELLQKEGRTLSRSCYLLTIDSKELLFLRQGEKIRLFKEFNDNKT